MSTDTTLMSRMAARPGLVPGVLAIAAFGLTLPLTRLGVLESSARDVMLVRLLLASGAACLWLLALRRPSPPRWAWSGLAWVIVGVVLGFPGFSAVSMITAGSAHGGVILGVLPLATAVAGCWVNRERPSLWFWLSALAGCVLVLSFAVLSNGSSAWLGDLWLLLAVLSAAFGYAKGGYFSQHLPAADVIAWALALMFPVALVGALFVDWHGLSMVSTGAMFWPLWGALLYLGLVSQFGGFLLWYRALALDGVAHASQLQLLQPFVTLLGAAVLVQETIDALTLFFAVLILLSVVLGALIGLLGIGLLFWHEIELARAASVERATELYTGLGIGVLATLLASFGNIASQRNQRDGLPVLQTNACGMGYGTMLMLVYALAKGAPLQFDPSPAYLLSLVYLAVFGSIFAFGAYLSLVGKIGADRAAYATVLLPVVALVISSTFEGFVWSPVALLGVALVLLGNALVVGRRALAGARHWWSGRGRSVASPTA